MKRPDNSVLFGIRKGIAIYFNDVIEKEHIKEIVRMLVDMTGVTFTGNQAQVEHISALHLREFKCVDTHRWNKGHLANNTNIYEPLEPMQVSQLYIGELYGGHWLGDNHRLYPNYKQYSSFAIC